MPNLVIKSNIKKKVEELQGIKENSQSSDKYAERDKEKEVTSVADEVGRALEIKVEELLREGIKRAKENKRRTLQARDL